MGKWLFVIQSILLAIIGILFFVYPIESMINLTMICGIFAIVAGILSIIKAFSMDRKGMFIFNGIIDLWYSSLGFTNILNRSSCYILWSMGINKRYIIIMR